MRPVLLPALILLAACGGRPDPYVIAVDLREPIGALGSDDLFVNGPALERIVALGPAALPALDAALVREPPAVRAGVVEALARLEVPAATALVVRTAATDADVEVRYDALQALASLRGEGSREIVERSLDDPQPKIRLAAARACGPLCSTPAAFGRLVEIAVRDRGPSNATWARLSLQRMLGGKDERAAAARAAITAIALPLVDGGAAVEERARAALLAGDIGETSGVPALAEAAAAAGDQHLRLQALYALGTVAGAAALPVVTRLLDDMAVRMYAVDALRRMAERRVSGADAALAAYTGPRPPGPLPPPTAL